MGELTGARLTPLPSLTTTWAKWRSLHPETLVLARDTGFLRDYDRDPFTSLQDFVNDGDFPFPVTDAAEDDRLEPGALVLGTERNGERRAYPIEALGDAAIADTLGGESIVVFSRADGPTAAAFRAESDGRPLTLSCVTTASWIRRRGVSSRSRVRRCRVRWRGNDWSRCLRALLSGSPTQPPSRRRTSTRRKSGPGAL